MKEILLDDIKDFSNNYYILHNEEINHNDYLKSLYEYLASKDFKCEKEHFINFKSYKRKNNEITENRGYIDLYLYKNNYSIAIEYDNGLSLKFKSIAKLLGSNSDLLIGIVKGKEHHQKDLLYNQSRVNFMKGKLKRFSKQIYVMSLYENKYILS